MEMHQVRYFLAVSRTLNFTRAAEECNVSQPALTRAVKHLEIELGGDLFRRERSLTQLTDLGRRLVPPLNQCLESALMAKVLAQSYKNGERAPLNIALSRTIPIETLTVHVRALTKAFPGVEAKFFRGPAHEIVEKLKKGDMEMAVAGPLGEEWERLEAWQLYIERFAVVVNSGNALARRTDVRLADLAGERLLARPHCRLTEQLVALLGSLGVEKTFSHEAASVNDLIDLVRADLGIAILPKATKLPEDVRAIDVDGVELSRAVRLYAVSGRQRSPAACGLIKLLRAATWQRH